jgi:hypothetical protein
LLNARTETLRTLARTLRTLEPNARTERSNRTLEPNARTERSNRTLEPNARTGTPETVSRWENGERQPETRAAKLLGLMVIDHSAGRAEIQQYLRSLSKVRTAPPTTERRLHFPAQIPPQPA